MALASYADLLTAVQNYEDDSSSVVTGIVGDMVTLAEQRIFYGHGEGPSDPFYSPPLRVKSMERTAVIPIGPGLDGGTAAGTANAITLDMASAPTLARGLSITFTASASNTGATTIDAESTGAVTIKKGAALNDLVSGDIVSGGVYTVYHDGTYYVLMPSDGAAPLPTNYLGFKNAYLQDRGTIITYQDQLAINIEMDGATGGTPDKCTIEGDCFRFGPLPDQDYKMVLTYYEKPSALSSAVNKIFTEAPGIYLFATLTELADYLTSEERAGKFFARYRAALGGYQNSQNRSAMTYGNTRVSFRTAP